jgi:hypothetical protein
MSIGKAVRAIRGPDYDLHTVPAVNVVFYVPGSVAADVPQKIEPSRFSRKQKLLLVAVPVPAEIVKSEEVTIFIFDNLHRASVIARDVFSQKNLPFDFDRAVRILEEARMIVAPRRGQADPKADLLK